MVKKTENCINLCCENNTDYLLDDSDLKKEIEINTQKLDNNINGFSLPVEVKNNDEYRKKVQELLEKYASYIDKPAFESENQLQEEIKQIYANIIKALDETIAGNNVEAENVLTNVLKLYINHEFGVSALNENYAFKGVAPFEKLHSHIAPKDIYNEMMIRDLTFFRARVVDKNHDEEVSGLEHIIALPYSKRYLSNDMRFSSKGEICLYLGTTSYVCSQECRWDEKSQNLYIAAFKFNQQGNKMKILNLAISEALINGIFHKGLDVDEYRRKLQNMMLKIFPLIIATSFTVNTPNEIRENKYGETNKFEYLLSQRLIKAIQSTEIDGIAYLSRQGKNDFQYPHGVNLAIPMSNICEDKEYSDLCKCFEMTKPVLVSEIKLEQEISEKNESYINACYP